MRGQKPIHDFTVGAFVQRCVLFWFVAFASTQISFSSALPVVAEWEGLFQTGALRPPDPHGAAGPNGVIATVNLRIAYFSKTGALIWGPANFSTFFAPAGGSGGGISDPRAVYDFSGTCFYVVLIENSATQSFLNLAVSKTSNPSSSGTNDWFFYRMEATEKVGGTSYAVDYPGLGYDGQCVYVTANMNSLPDGATFKNCQISIFKKSDLLAGLLTVFQNFTPDGNSNAFTLQPVSVIGNASPGNIAYFTETPVNNSTNVRLWALSDPLGARTLSSAAIPVPNNGGANSIEAAPQAGTTNKIPTNTPLTQGNAFWNNGQIWCCHTAGGTSGRAKVFYYKLLANNFPTNSPTLGESGAIDGGAGVWNFQPAIGGNSRGDVAVVYSQSSAVSFPAIYCAFRAAGEANFETPILIKQSPAYSNSDRWGDFASVTADPIDGSLWVCHEWAKSLAPHDWSTWWARLSIGQPYISSIVISNSLTTLTWTSIPGKSYRMQFKSNFLQTNWSNVSGDVTATNSTASKSDNFTGSSRFYRISVLP